MTNILSELNLILGSVETRADNVSSALDEIKGIGGKRKKALLTHFGSVQAIKSVSWEEISKVAGISEVLAKQIETALKS